MRQNLAQLANEKWQWQQPDTAWRGVGLYHITLTVPTRQPILGTLVIPNNDPAQAHLERTDLGNALIDAMFHTQSYHREIQILHFTLMPDHLHAVWYVRRPMEKGIASVAQSFLRAAKKLGRAYSCGALAEATTLLATLGKDAYYALDPIFTRMPHIQPMGHNSQLPATIDYLDMNPSASLPSALNPISSASNPVLRSTVASMLLLVPRASYTSTSAPLSMSAIP